MLKSIQAEGNDIIFKMEEFAIFNTKMQKISRTAYSILTIYTLDCQINGGDALLIFGFFLEKMAIFGPIFDEKSL